MKMTVGQMIDFLWQFNTAQQISFCGQLEVYPYLSGGYLLLDTERNLEQDDLSVISIEGLPNSEYELDSFREWVSEADDQELERALDNLSFAADADWPINDESHVNSMVLIKFRVVATEIEERKTEDLDQEMSSFVEWLKELPEEELESLYDDLRDALDAGETIDEISLKEKTTAAMKEIKRRGSGAVFLIGRPINGISLNGLEYVLDDTGLPMAFETEEGAKGFVFANGFTQEDLDNQSVLIVKNEVK
jgi:hypothetical protein